jgi:dTDP-4-amino-4,6-dideoxygalactose transaminase
MAAILADIQPGDEVIVPSYTFVSTANAFVLRGAKVVFADSRKDHPGIDESKLENLVTPNTKAIVPVHYAGVACDMDIIMEVAQKYGLIVIEDAAQAVDSFYTSRDGVKKPLGSIGHLATFSFHETKNIISGEGGLLVINDPQLVERAEVIWEKGTNRSAFYRGEVDKYGWVDVGSSFLPSEVTAAFLYAQLEHLEDIQKKRRSLWSIYFNKINTSNANALNLPVLPEYATNNAHMFYVICESQNQRSAIIEKLKRNNILAVFHYLSLHKSKFAQKKGLNLGDLPYSDLYTERLLRLPLYYELQEQEINLVADLILSVVHSPSVY